MISARILVCDDTPAKRYVMASWLRRAGFEVLESGTAAEAEALIRGSDVDLAILDVHLPDASGLEVTRNLRADPVHASTPVVHVSAIARETSDKVVALDQGADAYLVDPIEPEELLSTVRALLRTSGARRDAELLATRLARLSRAAVRLNVAASVPRLVEAAARAASEVLGGPAATLLLDGPEDGWRSATSTADSPAAAVPVPAAEVRGLLAPVRPATTLLDLGEGWGEHLPVSTGGWVGAPVRVQGVVAGIVAVPIDDAEDADQRSVLLQRLALSVAVALENLRALEFEHRTAVTLQRSLLPSVLPEPDGIQVAARYRASQQRVEVGGDFFDAYEVDGRCHLVIGDVQGHSLEAAVVMAELRYSLRAYAFEGHPPEVAVDLLDDLLVHTGPELTATACLVVVAADRRSFEVVSAGHLPPLLVRRGDVRQVEVTGALLGLGVADRVVTRHDLEPGDRLVLYTDGLVERRDHDLDVTVDQLARQVGTIASLTADDTADELLATWGTSEDDIALLVVDLT